MNPQYAEEIKINTLYCQTSGAQGRPANLREANLIGANLIGASLFGAKLEGADLGHTLPSRSHLIAILQEHAQSEQFNQSNWCGTNCCLSGRAGMEVGNQSAGVAVIALVFPEFDIKTLYQTDPKVALAELERIKNG